MTKEELRAQIKATAINSIRKIYHPLTTWEPTYSNFEDDYTKREQRDVIVERIMAKMEEELEALEAKFKNKTDKQ